MGVVGIIQADVSVSLAVARVAVTGQQPGVATSSDGVDIVLAQVP